MIKFLLLYTMLTFSAFAQLNGELTFEKNIRVLTEGDPLLLELVLFPIPENIRISDKLIGQNIIDSFNIVDILSEERDAATSQVKVVMNAVLFKKYENQTIYELQIEGLDKVSLKIQNLAVNTFDDRKEEVMVLDQPYRRPWNWKLFTLILLLVLLVSLPLIISSVKKYKKINLQKKNKLNEIKSLESIITSAKTRDDIERASDLLKKSQYVEKDNKVKSFLSELESIQYKRDWSSEDLRIFLSRLKEIKVI